MKKNKIKTSTIVLIIIAIYLTIFTGVMVWTFIQVGSCPDVLIGSVFSATLGELGVLSWIRTTKQKYPDAPQPEIEIEDDEDFTEEV